MCFNDEVTQLLAEWANGNQQALEQLTPLIYGELRQVALAYLRKERPDHTLQPTALVHEAYLRLAGQRNPSWQSRSHFYGVAAHLMREILLDHARRRHAGKRDGGHKVALESGKLSLKERTVDILALDEALNGLARLDPQQCRIVELRFFGGLTLEETAAELNISPATVKRHWATARIWLHHYMSGT